MDRVALGMVGQPVAKRGLGAPGRARIALGRAVVARRDYVRVARSLARTALHQFVRLRPHR
eukprot:12886371-Alexandrium_andersonii.AAC.1